ncbi:CD109 antigen-like [Mercenaria mercenaria]|uniref:CD109 antigen-like n=1 Tax=Mercenaria mercenaria TaxID=6596 RepID=UPI00234FA297|nr:CD109 antigen-like [Mercenaria mercenaria]
MVPSFIVLVWFILPNERLASGYSNYVGANAVQTYVKETEVQETSITFQQKSVRPGDKARLDLKSTSGSSFYVLAVDKSILLLHKGNDITESILPDLNADPVSPLTVSQSSTSTIYNSGMTVQYIQLRDPQSSTFSTSTSSWYDHYYYYYTYASYSVYASSKSASSVRTSTVGPTQAPIASTRSRDEINKPVKQETIRKKFPDTWLFINATADSSGRASLDMKVPDTVTTWVASCFAVSAQSKITTAARNAELEVFLPFFISLQLPFSVIRNEQLVLQANIFNYHTEDLYVLVTLKKSSQFRGLAVVKRGRRRKLEERCGNVVLCIFAKAGRGTAAFFPIVPTETGKVKITITADSSLFKDTVIKYLRVESEGAPKDVAYPFLIDLTQETTFDTRFDLNYPPNTVDGSQRMRVSLIGDIMGPTIDGLDRLVRMPYGCGEQNMISTAPSVFVYRYLSAVGKLTDELKEKAEQFMRIGMQRQLRYRHTDWSFSAWGGSGSGSTWLTSFVLKVFSMASSYVEIDDQIVTESADWLISIQNADGSFPEKGSVGSRSLQGGASGTIERMTAYVLIALLEGRKASSNVEFCPDCLDRLDSAIMKASNYVSNNLNNQTSVYTVAISTYALTSAGHKGAERARNMLDGLSVGGAGQKYWQEPNQPPVSRYHYGPSTQAVSIEMTAYGLLAFVESGNTATSLLIQKWLISQRNPYGGFISTQDTVIALQALSELGAQIKADDPNMNIILSYTDNKLRKKKFKVNTRNAMIMQTADISTDTKTISIHAWGTIGTTAILTVSLFYNIFMDLEGRSLRLEVTLLKETINGFTLRSCVSWLENDVSGMIVVEIGIPSGFEANRWGISPHDLLKRTEIEDRKVILYYDEVTFSGICTVIPVVRDKMVANIKPVPCKAYEYYEPSNEVTVFYLPLSAKNANICDICGVECGCKSPKEKLWFPQSWCKKKI